MSDEPRVTGASLVCWCGFVAWTLSLSACGASDKAARTESSHDAGAAGAATSAGGSGGQTAATGGTNGSGGAAGVHPKTCGSLTASGDSIVDSATQLTWRNTIFAPETIDDATTACSGWGGRLPTEAELKAFATDATICTAELDVPDPNAGQCVWSSTKDPANAADYECVFFDGTPSVSGAASADHWVVCVK